MKKNVLFLRTGPPRFTSKSLLFHGGLHGGPLGSESGVPPETAFRKKFAEFSFVLRNDSEAPPCHSFPPDFGVTMTTEPEFRPNSAFIAPVTIRISATAFGETNKDAASGLLVTCVLA